MSNFYAPRRPIPAKVATAANYMFVLGAFKALPLVMILGIVAFGAHSIDSVGWTMMAIFVPVLTALVTCSFTAGILIRKGNPKGRLFAWCVLPFTLLGFPLLTILSVVTITALHSREVSEYLTHQPQGFPVTPTT